MEFVYCGGCGKLLPRDQARILDNRPWCPECKPPERTPIPIPAQQRKGSSAKLQRVTPAPLPKAAPPNRGLWIGLAIAGAVLLLILAALGTKSSPPVPAPVTRPPTNNPPPPPGPDPADADRAMRELESFASLAAPDKILARCAELWPRVRGTAHEKRFQAIEAAARDRKKSQEQEVQLAAELESIQKIIDGDPRFSQADEVRRRLAAAKGIAGARASEIDRRLADYDASRKSSPHEKHAGPFVADDQGYVRHWLILGLFPNPQDQGLETDYLNSEATHDPVAGLQVGKGAWTAYAGPEPKINFYSVPHLGKGKENTVAYAACLIQVPVDVAAEFRVGSDDGFALRVDGKLAGKVNRSRSFVIDQDRYAIPLSPGVHRVLLKVENRARSFEFALRIVDPNGNRIPSLRIWN